MRVFTRQPRQSLLIGANVTLTVMEIRGTQVRIGLDAPRDVVIQRKELLDKTQGAARQPDK
jgi:carbon storage regulator